MNGEMKKYVPHLQKKKDQKKEALLHKKRKQKQNEQTDRQTKE